MPRLSAQHRHAVSFTLNGKPVTVTVETRTLLTDALRHGLGLTGTHVGCEHGVCGACVVAIDGSMARACLVSAVAIEGCDIRTVEDLAPEPGRLGPLQAAFRRHHALQCGFCTAGILMSLDTFLRTRPNPTRDEIVDLVGGHLCRCTGYTPIIEAALEAAAELRQTTPHTAPMLDLGTSFLASVSRDPHATAIVDGDDRLTYAQWYEAISGVVAGLDAMGLGPGDHLVTVLQNRWEAATLHWACQFAGVIMTPLNWRATTDEIDFALADADARVLAYEEVAAESVRASAAAMDLPRIVVGFAGLAGETAFGELLDRSAAPATPRADAAAWSLMLYTSGTTARPKGVPRRHRAERAAALAHVAQNMYARGERTLGVMPLYHTMGVRSLLAMSLIGGTFVCLRRFSVSEALRLIATERVSNLYLVPTLFHDLVHHREFAATDVSSVRKLGFAGASMTDGLLNRLQQAFSPRPVRQPLRIF